MVKPHEESPTAEAAAARGPFSDLLIIEIGQFVVGPFCGQFLADGGARVIKIEPLEGDSYRRQDTLAPLESRQFTLKNRGKESLPLKLGHPGATEVLQRLLRKSDVLIANTRSETLRRYGLDYPSIADLNPRLVYALATGFGTLGPDAKYGAMDVVAQARSGLLMALGTERDGLPYHSEVQAADYASSILLLSGVCAALYERTRTGRGQEVSVSLLGGALTLQNNVFGHFFEHDGWREKFVQEVLPTAKREGWPPSRIAEERRRLRPDPRDTTYYRVFRTSDGMIAVGAGSPQARSKFLSLLGLDDSVVDLSQRRAEVEEKLEMRTTAEWLGELRKRAIPVSEVNHVDEVLFDDHFIAEGLTQDFHHPALGEYRALGAPIKLGRTPFRARRTSPAFGEHTEEILSELGFDSNDIQELQRSGATTVASHRPSSV